MSLVDEVSYVILMLSYMASNSIPVPTLQGFVKEGWSQAQHGGLLLGLSYHLDVTFFTSGCHMQTRIAAQHATGRRLCLPDCCRRPRITSAPCRQQKPLLLLLLAGNIGLNLLSGDGRRSTASCNATAALSSPPTSTETPPRRRVPPSSGR